MPADIVIVLVPFRMGPEVVALPALCRSCFSPVPGTGNSEISKVQEAENFLPVLHAFATP
jgi:hypothetical protein